MIYNQWDVIVTQFPFSDSAKSKPRPVIVISKKDFNGKNGHLITAMITTAKKSSWKYDTEIKDLDAAGLSRESYIRMKFFTLDLRLEPRIIGSLSEKDRKAFIRHFKSATF